MSTVRFRYEGVLYQVDVVRDGDTLAITHEGRTFRVDLEPAAAPESSTPATVSPRPAPAPAGPAAPATSAPAPATPTPAPPASPPGSAAPPPASAGPGVLPAPMAGTVKEVKVAAGERVSAGQLVVVMEAMKMDIDVTAPAGGTVAAVHVSAGDNRAAGQPLLTIH